MACGDVALVSKHNSSFRASWMSVLSQACLVQLIYSSGQVIKIFIETLQSLARGSKPRLRWQELRLFDCVSLVGASD